MADPLDDYKQQLFFIVSAVSWCTCLLQIVGMYLFNRHLDSSLSLINEHKCEAFID